MKISMLNTYDNRGGAAKACERLVRGLSGTEAEISYLVREKLSERTSAIPVCTKMEGRLSVLLEGLPQYLYPHRQKCNFSFARGNSKTAKEVSKRHPDIIHLHWVVEGFVRLEELAKSKVPVVWTMHDMWPFTGGCHYADDCRSYCEQCGSCPVLGSPHDRDLSRKGWLRKAKVLQDMNVTYVAPSHWLADCCRSSSLTKDKKTIVVPNGIDTSLYVPMDRMKTRVQLGLPVNKRLMMFGAFNALNDHRKGFHQLEKGLVELEKKGWADSLELVVVGSSGPVTPQKSGFKCHYLGYVSDEALLAALYATADVFVAPSLQENLANTVMEAMSCGTPCVAFNVGGMPDLIDHKYNGYLVRPFDIEDLVRGIVWVVDDLDRCCELSSRARGKVETEFSLEVCVNRYLDLYRTLVAEG